MTESIRRFDLRVNLWNSRQHAQATSQDSFDRVKVLSPSLADSLLQRTTQDREKTNDKSRSWHTMEKWTEPLYHLNPFLDDDLFYLILPLKTALPYLRSSAISKWSAPFFVQHKSLPKLRTVQFCDECDSVMRIINDNIETKFFYDFGPQMQSFTYKGGTPFELISFSIVTMSRLKTLKFEIGCITKTPITHDWPNIVSINPWHELSTFSYRNDTLHDFCTSCPFIEYLFVMTQLRQLAIKLSFRADEYTLYDLTVNWENLKALLTQKFGKINKFSKLEVLSFGVEPPLSQEVTTLDYRFLLDLLAPKLGGSLKKLIFQVPYTLESTSNCILLDYSNEFAHLETLVLKYPVGDLLPTLLSSEDKRPPSLSIRHLTIMDFNQKSLNSIFEQVPTIFPNLVELNLRIQADQEKFILANLTDQDTSKMISRLVHLRTLRFMDNYPKLANLYGSIELMCKRATELKPKVPMQFRVPIVDGELKHLKYAANLMPDELKPFYCWEKAAKWIQLC